MELIREVDYGTPARVSETLVTLEIDGKAVTVPVGTSVMRAAAELGVQVPKLCASDNLVERIGQKSSDGRQRVAEQQPADRLLAHVLDRVHDGGVAIIFECRCATFVRG